MEQKKHVTERMHTVRVSLYQECQTHFHWEPHQPHGFLQGAECNFRTI